MTHDRVRGISLLAHHPGNSCILSNSHGCRPIDIRFGSCPIGRLNVSILILDLSSNIVIEVCFEASI